MPRRKSDGMEEMVDVVEEKPQEVAVEPNKPHLGCCPRDGATRFQIVTFGQVTMGGEVLQPQASYVCVSCHGVWTRDQLAEHRWMI